MKMFKMNKRFKYGRTFPINSDDSLPVITDNENDKDYFKMLDIVDLLNELSDENRQLKEENEFLKMKNDKVDIETLLKLLVCIATSDRGWTDEERWFIKLLERELFPDE